jgi:hypothetical protein
VTRFAVLPGSKRGGGIVLPRGGAGGGGAFDPLSLSPALWLKADALALADAAAVSSWTDSSGNARHATQGTGANQPTYRTNIVNGKPVIRFDGSTDHLVTPALPTAVPAITVVTVAAKRTAWSNGTYLYETPTTGAYYGAYFSGTGGGHPDGSFAAFMLGGGGGGQPFTDSNGANAPLASFHINDVRFDTALAAAEVKMQTDGGTDRVTGAGVTSGNFDAEALTIGAGPAGSGACDCDLAELLLFTRILTAQERTDLKTHLAASDLRRCTRAARGHPRACVRARARARSGGGVARGVGARGGRRTAGACRTGAAARILPAAAEPSARSRRRARGRGASCGRAGDPEER